MRIRSLQVRGQQLTRRDGARVGAAYHARYAHPVLVGGVLVGVLDILAAFALRAAYGGSPIGVLQGIAGGLLGPSAFAGGTATAALGLVLHFLIAFGAAAVYYAASRRLRVLVRRPVLSGLAYGVVVHAVMSQVVLPLSRLELRAVPWHYTATMVLIHMLFVGLPIALAIANERDGWPSGRRLQRDG